MHDPGMRGSGDTVTRRPRWAWVRRVGLAALLSGGIWLASTSLPVTEDDPLVQVRADAAAAVQALEDGDLVALDRHLAARRGQPDFAYFFAAQVTPLALGDALATVAGPDETEPLAAGIDPDAYEMQLVDLAGILALATYGTGERALSPSWTGGFISATTYPAELAGGTITAPGPDALLRAKQDVANKRNLLLLLSRGSWSTEFLEAVTDAYWEFDQEEGDAAWPDGRLDGAKYAPAPNGSYLTDGMLALIAALTANPSASNWAFTDFQPGTEVIEGSDHAVGKFTHHLLFEHHFPDASNGETVGMTAVLTALSSAIDATGTGEGPDDSSRAAQDSIALQALADDLSGEDGCSWNPGDYWKCAQTVAHAVGDWVQHWGHLVLDVLTLATFLPPPFTIVGVLAAAANATWYAIEGDYVMAGLSLAAAVPGLAYTKVAKGAEAAAEAKGGAKAVARLRAAAAQSTVVARASSKFRVPLTFQDLRSQPVTADYLRNRPYVPVSTRRIVEERAPKTAAGDFTDPNTGQVLRKGEYELGHKAGSEYRCIKAKALAEVWSLQELLDYVKNPDLYQIEGINSNRSRKYEAVVCAI